MEKMATKTPKTKTTATQTQGKKGVVSPREDARREIAACVPRLAGTAQKKLAQLIANARGTESQPKVSEAEPES